MLHPRKPPRNPPLFNVMPIPHSIGVTVSMFFNTPEEFLSDIKDTPPPRNIKKCFVYILKNYIYKI